MSPARRCSRTACTASATATLTYVYAESKAVLGPLAPSHEPHCYDLCATHAAKLTVPRGWEAVHVDAPRTPYVPSPDDLEALADAVREAARADADPAGRGRAHLRVLRSPT